MNKFTIIVEDISEGKHKGYCATIPELDNGLAMGDNLKELFEGVALLIETCRDYKIGIFKKTKKKMVIRKIAISEHSATKNR